jgi:hypothetical protein
VHLPSITADATEGAGFPRFSDGAYKEAFLASFFVQGMVGGWKKEWLAEPWICATGEKKESQPPKAVAQATGRAVPNQSAGC